MSLIGDKKSEKSRGNSPPYNQLSPSATPCFEQISLVARQPLTQLPQYRSSPTTKTVIKIAIEGSDFRVSGVPGTAMQEYYMLMNLYNFTCNRLSGGYFRYLEL
jgi:hypothetical protein